MTREVRCQRGPWSPFPRVCPHRGEGDSWGAAPTRPALGALQLAKRGGLWHVPQKPPVGRRSWSSREPRPREGDQAGGQREVACKGGVCSHFTGEKTEAPGGHRTPMRPYSGGEELSLGPNQATPPPPHHLLGWISCSWVEATLPCGWFTSRPCSLLSSSPRLSPDLQIHCPFPRPAQTGCVQTERLVLCSSAAAQAKTSDHTLFPAAPPRPEQVQEPQSPLQPVATPGSPCSPAFHSPVRRQLQPSEHRPRPSAAERPVASHVPPHPSLQGFLSLPPCPQFLLLQWPHRPHFFVFLFQT